MFLGEAVEERSQPNLCLAAQTRQHQAVPLCRGRLHRIPKTITVDSDSGFINCDPAISPLRNYQRLLDLPSERWPVFPTFDQRTLAPLVSEELADRGLKPAEINEQ